MALLARHQLLVPPAARFAGARAALAVLLRDELPDAGAHRSDHHDQGSPRRASDGRVPRQALLPRLLCSSTYGPFHMYCTTEYSVYNVRFDVTENLKQIIKFLIIETKQGLNLLPAGLRRLHSSGRRRQLRRREGRRPQRQLRPRLRRHRPDQDQRRAHLPRRCLLRRHRRPRRTIRHLLGTLVVTSRTTCLLVVSTSVLHHIHSWEDQVGRCRSAGATRRRRA